MKISQDVDAMFMQALVVRERILGPSHRKTMNRVLNLATDYGFDGFFQRCLDLWKHVLRNFQLDLTSRRS